MAPSQKMPMKVPSPPHLGTLTASQQNCRSRGKAGWPKFTPVKRVWGMLASRGNLGIPWKLSSSPDYKDQYIWRKRHCIPRRSLSSPGYTLKSPWVSQPSPEDVQEGLASFERAVYVRWGPAICFKSVFPLSVMGGYYRKHQESLGWAVEIIIQFEKDLEKETPDSEGSIIWRGESFEIVNCIFFPQVVIPLIGSMIISCTDLD